MKKSIRLLALLLSVIMVFALLAGCKDTTTEPPATNGNDTTTSTPPVQGGEDDTQEDDVSAPPAAEGVKLNLSISEPISTVDPAMANSMWSQQMINLTNQGLMMFGADGGVTYGLADSYTVSDDGMTYTFHIRDDAFWSNGDKVTAFDFLYSWQRVTDPANAAPCAYALGATGVVNGFAVAYGGADLSTLGISAPDESTFIVTIDAPRSYFLYLLALASYLMPVSEAYVNSVGDQFGLDMNNYLACGPYVFSEWEVGGTSYTFVKNENYWDKDSVTCDEITWSVITDTTQQMMAWDNGTLDMASLSGDYVAKYKNDPGLYVADMAAMFYVTFNHNDANIGNENLRLALSYAIDKQAIVDGILNNGSRAANYILPETFAIDSKGVYFRDNIGHPEYNAMDKAKAVEYWEAAKAELGVEALTLDFLYNEDSVLALVSAFLQSEWQNALPGLTVNLVQTTYNDRLDRMSKQDYQFGLTRWFADYPDASTYIDMFVTDAQMNYGKYSNAEYDAMHARVNGELALDEQGRIDAFKDMEAIFLGEAGICPLYQLAACSLRNPDYNWVTNAAGVAQYNWVSRK